MSLDSGLLDVLESGREPEPRRRVVAVALLVVLVLVSAAGWYVDHRERGAEFAALTGCARRGASEVAEATARVIAMAEYVRPALSFATERTARSMYGMVAHEAADIGPGLQQAQADCVGLDVAPWHSPQLAAQRAQVAYLDAELAMLARTAADGRAYFLDQGQISDLRAGAGSALVAARPGLG